MRQVWGEVVAVDSTVKDLQKLRVSVAAPDGVVVQHRALCYPSLSGPVEVGDTVLLNTTAVDLALGTGGSHFVIARKGEGVALDDPAPLGGHIMKLRYTPLQRDVLTVEDPASPYHDVMEHAVSIDGMPVVCCGLHSQVPLVAAAIKQSAPRARVVYCMTDGAALTLAFSDLVRSCVSTGFLDETVSCGQAFGGGLEAINLHSGLLAAHLIAKADVAIVAIGPGVVGSGTAFGHGGIAQGEALNAVAALRGTPIACLRCSFADARERHRGVSHHTLSALTRIALSRSVVAVPSNLPVEWGSRIAAELAEEGVLDRHAVEEVEVFDAIDLRGIRVTTMGRGIDEDPAFFAAAFAAGLVAGNRVC